MRPILPTYVIEFNDALHTLVRKFKERENLPIEEIKAYYDCDTVLKKDGMYYFCQKIQEPEYEETKNNDVATVADRECDQADEVK